MITFTNSATEQIKIIAAEENLKLPVNIRASVTGGGCAGFTHNLEILEISKTSEFDEIFESKYIIIHVDPLSYQYLNGTTIDYVIQAYGGGFKFINPNVTSMCGCGSSFSV